MNIDKVLSEIEYKSVRSSGSGGQHVNKVATKVELYFNLETTEAFTNQELIKLKIKLLTKITKSGFLIMTCGETRSQYRNKTIVTKRFLELIKSCFEVEKKRKPTKIPNATKRKRLDDKKKNSDKKTNRQRLKLD